MVRCAIIVMSISVVVNVVSMQREIVINDVKDRVITTERVAVVNSTVSLLCGRGTSSISNGSRVCAVGVRGDVIVNGFSCVARIHNTGSLSCNTSHIGNISTVGNIKARNTQVDGNASAVGAVRLENNCQGGMWYVCDGPAYIRDSSVKYLSLYACLARTSPLTTPQVAIKNSYTPTIKVASTYAYLPHVWIQNPTWPVDVTFSEYCGHVITDTPQSVTVTNGYLTHVGGSQVSDISSETSCLICLDEFTCLHNVYMLPCTHIFHNRCLKKWFRRSSTCPLCRSVVE